VELKILCTRTPATRRCVGAKGTKDLGGARSRISRNSRAAVRGYSGVMGNEQAGRGWLRRAFDRMAAPVEEIEAEDLRAQCAAPGIDPISDVVDRNVVKVKGTLRTVTLRPRAGLPALEAELYDGTGAVVLVWLGRRRIEGIETGRVLTASGRVSTQEGRRVIFNPRYELQPQAVAS
jgi:hypothetical protein